MALFSFGTSKASSQSTSSSQDASQSGQTSRSFSEGFSDSISGGQSTQRIAFEDLFRQLFGGATGAAAQVAEATPTLQGQAQQLFTGGINFLDMLQASPGADYMTQRLTGPDAAAEAQIGQLGTNLSQFFNEKLLRGITARGVSTGTLGGSREAVSTGLAAREIGGAYAGGVAQILGQSQAQRDSLAGTLNGQQIAAAQTGLNALPGLMGLSQAGASAALSPYLMLSEILGPVTTLTESSQFGQSSSRDIAQALSDAFSWSYGTSQSQSTSKARSMNIGFGGAPAG